MKFREVLSNVNWNDVYNKIDVDFAYENYQKYVLLCFYLSFPLSLTKHLHTKFEQPWFSHGLLISSKTKSTLYCKYIKGNRDKEQYVKYLTMYNAAICSMKQMYYKHFFESNRKNIPAV